MSLVKTKRAHIGLLLGCWLVVGGLVSVGGRSWAAGMFLPGRGVEPMGRAGASFAGGDTLQTIWYNPANLVEFTGFSALVDLSLINLNASFARAERKGMDGKTITYDPVENEATIQPDPSVMLAYGWKEQRVTLAFGLYAPYAGALKFPDTGAQRYSLVDMSGTLLLYSHLALAWAPHPRFRLGAGFQVITVQMRMVSAASAYLGLFGSPEDSELDLYTEMSLFSAFNPTGNLGLWGRIVESPVFSLDLALSVQLPARIEGVGSLKTRLPTHPLFDPTTMEGDQARVGFWFPYILRGAVRATILKRVNVEAAFVYEGWSMHDTVSIQPLDEPGIWVRNVPTIGDYKIRTITIPRAFRDAFSIRLGGDVLLVPGWLRLRLGYTYEGTAIPDKTTTVFIIDADKHMLGLGLSLLLGKKMALDLSFAHFIMTTRNITNSEYPQVNPINPEGAIFVGNGRYESSYNIVGLAWRGSF